MDTDNNEDAIIYQIECSVADFFVMINGSSEKGITANKQSMSTIVTKNLFSQLNKDGIKKLPDRKIIVDTIIDFMDNHIDELSKIEIEKRTNELSDQLIDILLVKFDINPHKNDDDEAKSNADDAIINQIECSIADFFVIINDSSEKEITAYKQSMSRIVTDNLFSQLKKNGIKKLPDEKMILNTIIDFMDNIDELSKIEIKKRTNELSDQLIDILLVKFDMNPHNNDNDEAESNADNEILTEKSKTGIEVFEELYNECLRQQQQLNDPDEPCHGQQGCEDSIIPCWDPYTPPATPGPKKTYKCGVCREEGHNRTSCPLNKSRPPASKSTAKTPETPKRSYTCGVCGNEGHNRTTCSLNKSRSPASKSTAKTPETPKRSYTCGVCGNEGHNRTTCSLNKSRSPASKSTAKTPETPKRSYTCGVCGNEGHNRTTCPLNKSASPASKSTAKTPETPKRSYTCGVCGNEGHNRTTCPLNKSASPASKSTAKTPETPKRSYTCGVCGNEGHNRTTCPLNKSASPASKSTAKTPETPKRSYTCGVCGNEGHNRTTCPLNQSASPASKHTVTISETPKRSYRCGRCGNEGHNISTCPVLKSEISSPKPAATSTPLRSYTCGLCGGEGHNRTTCSRNSVTSTTPTRAAPRCSTCGGEGHNSRTCGRRETSSSFYNAPSYSSYSSYSSPASSYSGGGSRSYTCGNCGGSGHNRRTCSH